MTDLRIGRLANRYVLPRGPQPVAALQARLDRAAAEYLDEALDGLAAGMPEATGDEVWLVRRLHVEVAVGVSTAGDPGALARAWSQQTLTALREALQRGGADVVRFPSRAAWTARFVVEAAAGTAWDRWYLGAFASLRPLPVGRAIAEAVAREPGTAPAVLAELWRSGELERVLLALGPGEARRVVDAIAPPGRTGTAQGRALVVVLGGLRGALRPADDPHLPGAALRLLAAACADGVALPPGAGQVAEAVVVIADLLASAGQPRAVAAAVASRRWAEALRLAGRPAANVTADDLAAVEVLHDLADGDEGWLGRVAADLAPGTPSAVEGAGAPMLATRFGGLLLLWPVVEEAWGRVEEQAVGVVTPLHRLLVAAHLFGAANVSALMRDPVLALLCGLDHPPVPADLAEARAGMPVEALLAAGASGPDPDPDYFGEPRTAPARSMTVPELMLHNGHPSGVGQPLPAAAPFCAHVLDRFAARLPGFARSSPGYLLRNFLATPATLRLDPDGWHATLTPPPLEIALRMAGLTALTYPLPSGLPLYAALR